MSLSGMGCFRRRSAATAIATTALLLGLAAPADGAVAIIGSPRVDFIPVAVCIAGIVAFTIIFEIALESLEHKLESYPLYEEMLQHVIKEVMILGLISFTLFMLEQAAVLDVTRGVQYDWVVGFEFSHILIFYMALFFIAKSAVVIRVCGFSSRQWTRLQLETFEQTLDKFAPRTGEDKQGPRVIAHPGYCRRFSGNCSRVMASLGEPNKQDLIWQLMSMEFNKRVRMTHADFDFARYMRVSLRVKVAHAMHITWQIWAVCAVTLVSIFAAWAWIMGCDSDSDSAQRRQLGGAAGDEEVVDQCYYKGRISHPCDYYDPYVELQTNSSGRRQLAALGPPMVLDEDTARAAVVSFCIFGWALAMIQFIIAWRMEVQEEAHHFEALGLTETLPNGKKKNLQGQELLDAVVIRYHDFRAHVKALTDVDDSGGAYTMPKAGVLDKPTITMYVGKLPSGLPDVIPQLEGEVQQAFEAAIGKDAVTDVRIRVKPPLEALEDENSDAAKMVSTSSIREMKVGTKPSESRSWGIVTVYGDMSQLKTAKADPAMKAKGWQISIVDRKKLSSLQAKIFLQKADNLAENNYRRSRARLLSHSGDSLNGDGNGHEHGHGSEHGAAHGHGHGHEHGHGHGHGGGFGIQTGIDSLILLTCFYLALYTLFIIFAINLWSGWSLGTKIWVNILVITPAVINLGWIGPAALKAAAVVHGIQEIDESAIKTVLEKMDLTIVGKAELREALRREYGVEQPHPERKQWSERFKDIQEYSIHEREVTKFGTWFKLSEESVAFFNQVAAASTEDELLELFRRHDRAHIQLEKDEEAMYFKAYPQTPCPPMRINDVGTDNAQFIDGMRDLLIADETARLILKTEGGLGELAGGGFKQAAAAQLTKTITARPDSAGSSICRRDALRKFYMGQRLDPNTLEWVPAAAKACRALTEREFVWVIRSVDPDQSGVLDRHELTLLLLGSESCLDDKKKKHQQQLRMQCAAALTRQAEHKEGMAVEEKVADYRRIFHLYDTDKSGEISWTELQAVLTTVTGHVPAESEVKDMIATVDEDGSGDIDFTEFLLLISDSLGDAELEEAATKQGSSRQRWKKAVRLLSVLRAGVAAATTDDAGAAAADPELGVSDAAAEPEPEPELEAASEAEPPSGAQPVRGFTSPSVGGEEGDPPPESGP